MAAVAGLFGACTSGSSGCDGGPKKDSASSSSFSGGGANPGGGGGESVSFQKMGLQRLAAARVAASTTTAPSVAMSTAGASAGGAAATENGAAAAASAEVPTQTLLCGGFPGLPEDCLTSPLLPAIHARCCPDGAILACRAIPAGAKLTVRGCGPASP